MQAPDPGSSDLSARVVDAVDHAYLYANDSTWEKLRRGILPDSNATLPSLARQLEGMHDGDLRIVTANQLSAMQAETGGKEQGIGLIDFAVTVGQDALEAWVVTPLVGSPAFKAGVLPGDIVVSIDGRPTRSLIHEDVMEMLRSNSGTRTLAIRRGGKQLTIKIRAKDWVRQAVISKRIVAKKHRLGYIRLSLFTPGSGNETRHAVASLVEEDANECILDLRNNPGGYLDAMASAGSAFTGETLGKVRRDGTKEPIHSTEKPFSAIRLIILVNEGTASAAEILAAGLGDTIGARILGTKTYGRAQIQTYVALNDNAGIVIPSATAETPLGTRFNKGTGISPDILVSPGAANRENYADDPVVRQAVDLLIRG